MTENFTEQEVECQWDETAKKRFLNTKRWKEHQQAIRLARNNTCEVCGKTDTELDVHHLNPRMYDILNQEDFILVCKSCHKKMEGTSEETRIKIKETMTRTLALPEQKARLVRVAKALWSDPNYHKRASAAIRERTNTPHEKEARRIRAKKLWGNDEYRKNVTQKAANACRTPEQRAARSERTKALWATQEYREKRKNKCN